MAGKVIKTAFQSAGLLQTCHRPQDMTALKADNWFPKSPATTLIVCHLNFLMMNH